MLDVVAIADTHLKSTEKYGKPNADGTNSRLQDKIDAIDKAVKYALKEDVDLFVHLGDVYDKINPSEFLRSKFLNTIKPLIGKIPIIIVIGNHDTDENVFSLMADDVLLDTLQSDDIMIFEEPSEIEVEGVEFLILPWKKDEIIEKELKAHKNKIVLGHFGVDGALASGSEFVLSKGVSQRLFERHLYTFLGHYHRYQHTNNFMYVGSVARADFGERNDPKGFVHFKVSDKNKVKTKFIDVKDRNFFQYTVSEEDDHSFDALYEWEDLEGDIVKIIFHGSEEWYLSFNLSEIRHKVLDVLGAHRIFIDHKKPGISKDLSMDIDLSSNWREGLEYYTNKKNRKDMLDLGEKIINEVL